MYISIYIFQYIYIYISIYINNILIHISRPDILFDRQIHIFKRYLLQLLLRISKGPWIHPFMCFWDWTYNLPTMTLGLYWCLLCGWMARTSHIPSLSKTLDTGCYLFRSNMYYGAIYMHKHICAYIQNGKYVEINPIWSLAKFQSFNDHFHLCAEVIKNDVFKK